MISNDSAASTMPGTDSSGVVAPMKTRMESNVT
jgi:hypothetical protein